MARRRGSQRENVKILERGNIYFVYQPRVQRRSVRGFEDVRRLYIVLSPQDQRRYRMIVLPKKQLPKIEDGGQRYWGFVEKVSREAEGVEDEFDPESYLTQTRGERVAPAARPAGEGVYAIVRHGDHTHLVYALELPKEPKEVQEALNIQAEGSYILSIKNPEFPSPPWASLEEERQAEFPKSLQERFGRRRFAEADPPEFLDYEGAELMLIGASDDISEELGLELEPQEETEATAEIFNDLRMEKSLHPTEPLLKGKWA